MQERRGECPRRLEAQMLRLSGVSCIGSIALGVIAFAVIAFAVLAFGVLAFAAMASPAQINVRTLTLAGVSDCLAEALATNAVDEDGAVVVFSCNAAKAKTLYNFLGKRVHTEVIQDRNGKFENRAFGNSACYHRIEDSSGNAADEFRCDLIMAVGDALGE
jgi:hypothetical protein